jgi:hypothetical protein
MPKRSAPIPTVTDEHVSGPGQELDRDLPDDGTVPAGVVRGLYAEHPDLADVDAMAAEVAAFDDELRVPTRSAPRRNCRRVHRRSPFFTFLLAVALACIPAGVASANQPDAPSVIRTVNQPLTGSYAPLTRRVPATALRARAANPVTEAIKRAEEYWNGTPCGGAFVVAGGETPPAGLEAGPSSPALARGEASAQAWTNDQTCTITINTTQWVSWERERLNFHWFCDMMVHEVGHLPPFNHDDDGQTNPRSIEYPLLEPGTPNFNVVPQCR